jgi:2-C-methyl-D-erythritol 4-phosphate cytidylyltransferase
MIKNLGIVIAAGGSGSRFGTGNKLFENFLELPLFLHSVKNFIPLCPQDNLIIVAPEKELDNFDSLTRQYLPEAQIRFVAGGNVRAESVKNGLQALKAQTEFVAIHDAARPLASPELLIKCLETAKSHGGAIPAKRVTDTLKKAVADGRITDTIPRNDLWRVETPQVFNLAYLLEAFDKASSCNREFTDDAAIMEYAGHHVYIVDNPECNIKITYPEDIILLKKIAK